MQLKTRANGGKSSLSEVAAAWKGEVHNFEWSHDESDTRSVELAKKLNEKMQKAGPAIPDPRNIH